MSIFQTTSEERLELAKLVTQMHGSGLPDEFVTKTFELAFHNQGAFDLVKLWAEFEGAEREHVLANLQELIDDSHHQKEERPRLGSEALDGILGNIQAHKVRLRELVDKHGGVSKVAALMGIPQPSLSRMLNSGSMPRRTTLYKLAVALRVPESAVVAEWVQ